MKNVKSISILALILSLFAFCSCNGEPIFYNILQEVELSDPVVTGQVYSMVEDSASNKLYCCNGYIFSKTSTDERGWSVSTSPSPLSNIIRLAKDNTNLYAMTNGRTLYYAPLTDTSSWNAVTLAAGSSVFELFDNNADEAYYSDYTTNKVYVLNGATQATEVSSPTVVEPAGYSYIWPSASYTKPTAPISAVKCGGTTLFSCDRMLTSNGTNTFYNVGYGVVKYSTDNGANWTSVSCSNVSIPYSVCFYQDSGAAHQWIYVGLKTGVTAVNINNDIPTTGSTAVGQNLTSCLGDMTVIGLYPLSAGTGNVYAAAIKYLSTTAKSNTNKLWGYYPTRPSGNDNTWNCE